MNVVCDKQRSKKVWWVTVILDYKQRQSQLADDNQEHVLSKVVINRWWMSLAICVVCTNGVILMLNML